MRILLIDDYDPLVTLMQQDLRNRHHFDVSYALDPLEAEPLLRSESFDVVVVDLLYEHLTAAFMGRVEDGQVTLSDEEYLISGLAVLQLLSDLKAGSRIVIWTNCEFARPLYIVFAYQEFGVRSYCSKLKGADLAQAVKAAAEGRTFSDHHIHPYLPRPGMLPIGELLFGKQVWCGIWRAMALGARSRREIERLAPWGESTIGNHVSQDMAARLQELNPGFEPGRKPFDGLLAYAVENRPFFLDNTIIRRYPHSNKPNLGSLRDEA